MVTLLVLEPNRILRVNSILIIRSPFVFVFETRLGEINLGYLGLPCINPPVQERTLQESSLAAEGIYIIHKLKFSPTRPIAYYFPKLFATPKTPK